MVILRIEHPVPDFEGWLQAFAADPLDRRGSGVRRHRVLRPRDDRDVAVVDLEFDDVEPAERMQRALRELWARVEAEGLIGEQQAQLFDVVEVVDY